MTTDSKRWLTKEVTEGVVHVVPLDDTHMHVFASVCSCLPMCEEIIETITNWEGTINIPVVVGRMWSHQAWDGSP